VCVWGGGARAHCQQLGHSRQAAQASKQGGGPGSAAAAWLVAVAAVVVVGFRGEGGDGGMGSAKVPGAAAAHQRGAQVRESHSHACASGQLASG
jgi:hypothetical protein